MKKNKKYRLVVLDPTKIGKFSAEDYFIILMLITPFIACLILWCAWIFGKLT